MPDEATKACAPLYVPSTKQDEQRENNFTYHKPFGNQAERYIVVRECAKGLSGILDCQCPPSRELSLAQTNLEQAIFWANAAIARNEKE